MIFNGRQLLNILALRRYIQASTKTIIFYKVINNRLSEQFSYMGVLWKIYPCNIEEVFGKQKQNVCF